MTIPLWSMSNKLALPAQQTAKLWQLNRLAEPLIWRRSLENQHLIWWINSSREPKLKYDSKQVLGRDPKPEVYNKLRLLKTNQMERLDKLSQVSSDRPRIIMNLPISVKTLIICTKSTEAKPLGLKRWWKGGRRMPSIKSQITRTTLFMMVVIHLASRSLTGYRPCVTRWLSLRLRASTTRERSYREECSKKELKIYLKCPTPWPTKS